MAAVGPARRDDGGRDAARVNLNLVEEGVAGEDEGMGWMPGGFGKGQVWGYEHVPGRRVDSRRRHHGRVQRWRLLLRRSAKDLQNDLQIMVRAKNTTRS